MAVIETEKSGRAALPKSGIPGRDTSALVVPPKEVRSGAEEEVREFLHSCSVLREPPRSEPFRGTIFYLGRLSGNLADTIFLNEQWQRSPDAASMARSVQELLRGDEFEFDYVADPPEKKSQIIKPEFWEYDYDQSDSKVYVGVLRPLVYRFTESLFKYRQLDRWRVLDLLGGRGELADTLRSCAEMAGKQMDLLVFDRSNASREECGRRGIPHAGGDLSNVRLGDVAGTGLNLVTCMGGLTKTVVDVETAWKAAAEVYELLAPGGFFVLCGLTALQLNSRDFSSLGFRVINMAAHDHNECRVEKVQFYVLEKPSMSISDEVHYKVPSS